MWITSHSYLFLLRHSWESGEMEQCVQYMLKPVPSKPGIISVMLEWRLGFRWQLPGLEEFWQINLLESCDSLWKCDFLVLPALASALSALLFWRYSISENESRGWWESWSNAYAIMRRKLHARMCFQTACVGVCLWKHYHTQTRTITWGQNPLRHEQDIFSPSLVPLLCDCGRLLLLK